MPMDFDLCLTNLSVNGHPAFAGRCQVRGGDFSMIHDGDAQAIGSCAQPGWPHDLKIEAFSNLPKNNRRYTYILPQEFFAARRIG